MAYLAKHPGVADRIFEEVRDGLTPEGFPDGNVFERWPFTEAVVKEVRFCCLFLKSLTFSLAKVLRLRPSLPVGFAYIINPWTPPHSSVEIPGGSEYFVPFRVITTSESNFSHGTEFMPDRWLIPRDERTFPIHNPDAFVSFGGGKRHCLGRHLAMMEMKIALAYFCSRFTWKLSKEGFPEDYYSFGMFTRPFGLKMQKRNDN